MAEQATARVVNQAGLHARPISQFVSLAARFDARVTVTGPDGTVADGRSAFSMMTLAAGRGGELVIATEGAQAREALDALCKLVASGFGEP